MMTHITKKNGHGSDLGFLFCELILHIYPTKMLPYVKNVWQIKKVRKHILKTSLYSNNCKISIVMRSDDLNSVIRPTSSIINRRTF